MAGPPSLTRAQLVQDAGGGKTIRNPAAFALEFSNCGAGLKSKLTIELANIEAMTRKQLLKFQTLHPRKNAFVPRPVLHKRPSTAQAIGQVPDRQGIGFGRV